MKESLSTLAFLVFHMFLFASGFQPAGKAMQPGSSAESQIALIRHRYVLSVLPVDSVDIAALNAQSAKYAQSLRPDGTWADIDYKSTGRATWETVDHLQRTLLMAKSVRLRRNAGHPDSALEAKVMSALRVWTTHDYRNSNWWWNEIGVPELTGEIAALMLPQIPR